MKILSSEITPYKTFRNRRKFIKETLAISTSSLLAGPALGFHESNKDHLFNQIDASDKLNNYQEITNYNNYYEFGTGKTDPANYSDNFQPSPWEY